MGRGVTGLEYYSMLTINQLLVYFGSKADNHQDDVIRPYDEQELARCREELDEACGLRYAFVFEMLSSPIQTLTLQLALAQYMHPPLGTMVQEITGGPVSPQLAYKMLVRAGIATKPLSHEEYRVLAGLLVCEDASDNYMFSGMKADVRLVEYLKGVDRVPVELDGIASLSVGLDDYVYYGNSDRVRLLGDYLKEAMSDEAECFIQVAGRRGSGRRSLVRLAADTAGLSLVLVDYGRLMALSRQERDRLCFLVRRELLLYDAGLCMYDVEAGEKDLDGLFYMLEHNFLWLKKPIILATLPDTEIVPASGLPFITFEVGDMDVGNRAAVWEGYSLKYGIPLDSVMYGAKYTFTPEQVAKIFLKLRQTYRRGCSGDELERLVCHAAADIIPMPERGSIVKGSSNDTLDDLQLPEAQKKGLRAICSHTREFYKVFHDWNMQERFSYGRGMTALFAGPAGTGKTMAAGCIANELGLPLYRVDLSQVIDKYIGETEKKLNVVFDYAQAANVVLFFDEADALFGKRSEVKESKDKYANAEVSFILQRIEQYEGTVLLATNLINNIDEAFMRRMKYVIMFSLPDEDTRLRIWRGCFPGEVPTGDIDYGFLARRIELAGGHIKNIVLNAVFMAASEDSPVTMRHIIPSIQREFVKLGKSVGADYYEEYAHCLT